MSAAELEILVPERGRPDLLADTLDAAERALAATPARARCRVLVNGHPSSAYGGLRARFERVDWSFEPRALGFHGAIAALIRRSSAEWVFLLNSDMRLAPDAIAQCWAWRSPDVVAVAAQLEFADSARRREETGYTAGVVSADGDLELHDLVPPDEAVRGTVYAGGGASLFRRDVLAGVLALSEAYAPFYFEDADWSMQAWAAGYRTLFCPAARAIHVQRATIGRYHEAAEIERVVRRNLGHFRHRYGDLFGANRGDVRDPDWLERLARVASAEHRLARRRVRSSGAMPDPRWIPHQRYPHRDLSRAGFQRALVCAHRPLRELLRTNGPRAGWIGELASRWDVELVEPEEGDRASIGEPTDCWFRAIHPVARAAFRDAIERLRRVRTFDRIYVTDASLAALVEPAAREMAEVEVALALE